MSTQPPCVLVTRPAEQASAWVERLQAAGLQAAALPLIAIRPAADAGPLRQAWQDLARHDMLVFVSPNAVQQFFAAGAASTALWPANTLAATVGPGSSQALREAGVPASQVLEPAGDSHSFDSEALWQQQLASKDWQGRRVLLVRGDGGREWLGDRLRERGAEVAAVNAYSRVAPVLETGQQSLMRAAVAAPGAYVWLLSSSEAIDNLAGLAPPTARWQEAQAIATHARIAERAQQLGFGRVVAARPKLQAVVTAVHGLAGPA